VFSGDFGELPYKREYSKIYFQGLIEDEEIEDQLMPTMSLLDSGEYQTDVTLTSKNNVQYFNLKTFFMIKSRKLW